MYLFVYGVYVVVLVCVHAPADTVNTIVYLLGDRVAEPLAAENVTSCTTDCAFTTLFLSTLTVDLLIAALISIPLTDAEL